MAARPNTMGNCTSFAAALSLIDTDVKALGRTRNLADFQKSGKRWSSRQQDPDEQNTLLEPLLKGEYTDAIAALTGHRAKPKSIHDFVKQALRKAVALVKVPGQTAGTIYLYDWQNDELVMAASEGFPLSKTKLENVRDERSLPAPIERSESIAFMKKLLYIQKTKLMLIEKGFLHVNWVLEMIQDKAATLSVAEPEVDCNRVLPGIAYYTPESGITGNLFHKEKGPKLERLEDPKNGQIEKRLKTLLNSDGLLAEHLFKELFGRRTITFKYRAQMAAGRQVQAGTYEDLQFPRPTSEFIGPFLGTVLRFRGEHLGILKVELHKVGKVKDKDLVFKPLTIAQFLIFSYVLSGVLYLLKHNSCFDFRDAYGLGSSRKKT